MKNLLLVVATLLTFSVGATNTETTKVEEPVFCGTIKALYFQEISGRILAAAYLDQLTDGFKGEPLLRKKVRVTDAQVVFGLSRVVAAASMQNSEKLMKDLRDTQFEWLSYVGNEESTNPWEEDYVTCLKADISALPEGADLTNVQGIVKIYEDGFPL